MTYTAIECAEFGPVEDLRVVDRESPDLAAGQVRLAVSASGVNFVDGLFVQGRYQIKPPTPFVPGGEVVGRVVEVGDEVEGVAVGDRVFANLGLGGFASEAVVSPRQLVAIPDSLSDGQAATFMQSYLTGWYALTVRAGAQAGDTMLVLGAGSGVGLAAVDIGAALGVPAGFAAVAGERSSPAQRHAARRGVRSRGISARELDALEAEVDAGDLDGGD